MTREDLLRLIGSCLDYPSVYMGGASQQSMRKAGRILEVLSASGFAVVPVEATDEMTEAGSNAFYSPDCERTAIEDIRLMWRAMLSAAKEPGNE